MFIELSRRVVRAECYGESNSWNGAGELNLSSDERQGSRLALRFPAWS